MNTKDWLGFVTLAVGLLIFLAGLMLAIASPAIIITYLILQAL